jgi:hypothetical protein
MSTFGTHTPKARRVPPRRACCRCRACGADVGRSRTRPPGRYARCQHAPAGRAGLGRLMNELPGLPQVLRLLDGLPPGARSSAAARPLPPLGPLWPAPPARCAPRQARRALAPALRWPPRRGAPPRLPPHDQRGLAPRKLHRGATDPPAPPAAAAVPLRGGRQGQVQGGGRRLPRVPPPQEGGAGCPLPHAAPRRHGGLGSRGSPAGPRLRRAGAAVLRSAAGCLSP